MKTTPINTVQQIPPFPGTGTGILRIFVGLQEYGTPCKLLPYILIVQVVCCVDVYHTSVFTCSAAAAVYLEGSGASVSTGAIVLSGIIYQVY